VSFLTPAKTKAVSFSPLFPFFPPGPSTADYVGCMWIFFFPFPGYRGTVSLSFFFFFFSSFLAQPYSEARQIPPPLMNPKLFFSPPPPFFPQVCTHDAGRWSLSSFLDKLFFSSSRQLLPFAHTPFPLLMMTRGSFPFFFFFFFPLLSLNWLDSLNLGRLNSRIGTPLFYPSFSSRLFKLLFFLTIAMFPSFPLHTPRGDKFLLLFLAPQPSQKKKTPLPPSPWRWSNPGSFFFFSWRIQGLRQAIQLPLLPFSPPPEMTGFSFLPLHTVKLSRPSPFSFPPPLFAR